MSYKTIRTIDPTLITMLVSNDRENILLALGILLNNGWTLEAIIERMHLTYVEDITMYIRVHTDTLIVWSHTRIKFDMKDIISLTI